MSKTIDAIAVSGLAHRVRKSHWPARLDLVQSASGLFLGLFMWGHMAFVSTILISKDAMWWVTKMFEGQFIFGQAYPAIVGAIVAWVALLFVVHALLAMRKFPATFQQYRAFRIHRKMLRHADTTLWWVQAVTGFALFFLASVHLYQMLVHPGDIGPYESADRVWSYRWWPLYLVLLFCVEVHGGVGLYRLAVKWGWFEGESPDRTRLLLKRLRWGIIVFFIVLGMTTLAAEMKFGYEHRDRVGERYNPSYSEPSNGPGALVPHELREAERL
jgi:fumarate reductase subunit C